MCQLEEKDQALAREHVQQLSACLVGREGEQIRSWVSERIALEDATAQLFAARRLALASQNPLSTPLVTALKAFDALAAAAHRRALDWLEVLRRIDQPPSTTIKIHAAEQVAIMSDGGRR